MTTVGPLTLDLPDEGASLALGAAIGARLAPGRAVLLYWDLGAGKTTLARGALKAAAGQEDVPSPTYTLVQAYEALSGFEILHADLYRIEDPGELSELGLEEAFETAAVLVEWPERLSHRPANRLEVRLARAEAVGRRAALSFHGAWSAHRDDLFSGFTPR